MQFESEIQEYNFGNQTVSLAVPIIKKVKEYWLQSKLPKHQFPYWAKIWPAALGLCQFLVQNPTYITNKNILEIAAGLGLPSVLAAQYANKVVCSDYVADPLSYVQQSAKINQNHNVSTAVIDWNNIPDNMDADVILMSDVNYDQEVFPELEKLFHFLLKNDKTIILSTPQRLMAKSFITSMMPFCTHNTSVEVEGQEISIFIYIKK